MQIQNIKFAQSFIAHLDNFRCLKYGLLCFLHRKRRECQIREQQNGFTKTFMNSYLQLYVITLAEGIFKLH